MDGCTFLEARLQAHDDTHLYDGLLRGGYTLASAASQIEAAYEAEADKGGLDLRRGLGLLIRHGDQVRRVAWDSPAFRAGFAPGAVLESINDAPYNDEAP